MLDNSATSTAPSSLTKHFCIWLVVILFLKWTALTEPPVWDSAFGLFPAAGELADHGFNLPSLLQQPTYHDGGPNCHAESVVTWITAVVLWLVGRGPQAFVVLHLLHFSAAAWTLAVLHRLAAKTLGRLVAWMLCGTLLLCPLFRVQVGAMYFEIPLAACTIGAVAAYADGKLGRALIWSTLAVMVKQSGLAVAGALAVAALVRHGSMPKRLGLAMSFAGLGLVAAFGPVVFTPLLRAASDSTPPGSWWTFMSNNHIPYLLAIPDVTIGCGLLVIVGLFRFREIWRSLANVTAPDTLAMPAQLSDENRPALTNGTGIGHTDSQARAPSSAVGLTFLLLVMFGLFFFVAPYFAHLDFYCLPRYFVSLLPCAFLAGAYWMSSMTSPRSATMALAIVAMLFVGNRNGVWYREDTTNNVAVHERSESYRWIVAAQREAVQTVSNLPDNAVIYHGLPEHYFLQYPWLGYAARKHPGGRCVFLPRERPKSSKKEDLPERFFVIRDAPFLGDRELRAILVNAIKDPTRQVRLYRRCQHGSSRVDIVEVTNVDQPPQQETALDESSRKDQTKTVDRQVVRNSQ